ncbi:hypothetical protein C8F04DRAFT_1183543 [Mycena alexandri]|uniref:Uncharacterized protein n=1 Tax=Mycena alexandri TaxID=1745969 RepID=A0AAD6X072_9AGAR|nr:hypothetical protein C8F04DRAFT_1183543 [Mycena alexandri]
MRVSGALSASGIKCHAGVGCLVGGYRCLGAWGAVRAWIQRLLVEESDQPHAVALRSLRSGVGGGGEAGGGVVGIPIDRANVAGRDSGATGWSRRETGSRSQRRAAARGTESWRTSKARRGRRGKQGNDRRSDSGATRLSGEATQAKLACAVLASAASRKSRGEAGQQTRECEGRDGEGGWATAQHRQRGDEVVGGGGLMRLSSPESRLSVGMRPILPVCTWRVSSPAVLETSMEDGVGGGKQRPEWIMSATIR